MSSKLILSFQYIIVFVKNILIIVLLIGTITSLSVGSSFSITIIVVLKIFILVY